MLLARLHVFQPRAILSAPAFKHLEVACRVTLIGVLHARNKHYAVAAHRVVLREAKEPARNMFVPGDALAEETVAIALT